MAISIGIGNYVGNKGRVKNTLPFITSAKYKFAYDLTGYTNEKLKVNPRIKDISGNGHDLLLNNFNFTTDSGIDSSKGLRFDGVNDFGLVENLKESGRCLIVKFIQFNVNTIVFDQREGIKSFALYNADVKSDNSVVTAYGARMPNGITLIDNIKNNNILASELLNVNHVATLLHNYEKAYTTTITIGASNYISNYAKMVLYKIVLLDEIPSDADLKSIHDWMNIEGGYVETPDQYYDCYGKTNDSDIKYLENEATKQLNKPSYILNSFGFNWLQESGYGGFTQNYSKFGTNQSSAATYSSTYNSGTVNFKNNSQSLPIASLIGNYNNKSYKLKLTTNIPNLVVHIELNLGNPTYGGDKFATLREGITQINAIDDSIFSDPKYKHVMHRLDSSISSTIKEGDWYKIEELPQYPNALLFDGIDDHLLNLDIPAMNDYTVIAKRLRLNTIHGTSMFANTIDKAFETANSFIIENLSNDKYFAITYGKRNLVDYNSKSLLFYQTKNEYNGQSILTGSATPSDGFTVGLRGSGYTKLALYKVMLFPKTINNLSIKMLLNLFEKDEIINLNSKIFKK